MITSRDNAHLKRARALQTGKGRQREAQMLLEGSRLIEAAWEFGATFQEVLYCSPGQTARAQQLTVRLEAEGIPCYPVAEAAFRTVAETDTPQGIVAVVSRPIATWADLTPAPGGAGDGKGGREGDGSRNTQYAIRNTQYAIRNTQYAIRNTQHHSPLPPLVLAVEDLRDPGNLGTILRTAQAAGCSGVVLLGDTADVTQAKVLRAAQGAVFALPVIEGQREELVRWAQEVGVRLIATRADAAQTLYETDLRRGTVLLVGSEAHGLRTEWEAVVQTTVRIPMHRGSESLNAAVAAAVLLYEAVRQREFGSVEQRP